MYLPYRVGVGSGGNGTPKIYPITTLMTSRVHRHQEKGIIGWICRNIDDSKGENYLYTACDFFINRNGDVNHCWKITKENLCGRQENNILWTLPAEPCSSSPSDVVDNIILLPEGNGDPSKAATDYKEKGIYRRYIYDSSRILCIVKYVCISWHRNISTTNFIIMRKAWNFNAKNNPRLISWSSQCRQNFGNYKTGRADRSSNERTLALPARSDQGNVWISKKSCKVRWSRPISESTHNSHVSQLQIITLNTSG